MSSSQSHTPKPTISKSLIPVGLPATYIGSWAVVGVVSLGYLGLAATEPEGLTAVGPASQQVADAPKAQPTSSSPKKRAEKPADERPITIVATKSAQPPKASPVEKAAPIEAPQPVKVKTRTDEADASSTQPILARPHNAPPISTKYVSTQQILANHLKNLNSASPDQKAAQEQASKPPPAASPIVTGSITVPPPPDRGPPRPAISRSQLSTAATPARTAQITRKAPPKKTRIAFGPPVVTPSAETPALAILLATGSSVESLRNTWNMLKQRHSSALGDLNPRYIIERNSNAPDRKYALLAGPVISATDVARVCSVLVSEGLNCRTRSFTGNSL